MFLGRDVDSGKIDEVPDVYDVGAVVSGKLNEKPQMVWKIDNFPMIKR